MKSLIYIYPCITTFNHHNININLKYPISILLLQLIKLAIICTIFSNKLLGVKVSTYIHI